MNDTHDDHRGHGGFEEPDGPAQINGPGARDRRDEPSGHGARGRLDESESEDPRFEQLVALLYDELPSAEAEALQREIARNPALRRAWEEIRSARESLAELPSVSPEGRSWDPLDMDRERLDPDRSAAFGAAGDRTRVGRLVADQIPRPGRGRAAGPQPSGRWRSWSAATAWGMAAAALLLLALGLARFRVERLDHGLAFTVGEAPRAVPPGAATSGTTPTNLAVSGATANNLAASGATTNLVAPGGTETGGAAPVMTAPSRALPVGQDIAAPPAAAYVTREELRAYATELTRSLAVALDERASQRDADLASWMQVAFQEVSRRQAAGYGDLRGRIEEVGVELARGQDDANERINLLLRQDRVQPNLPAILPVTGEEGVKP